MKKYYHWNQEDTLAFYEMKGELKYRMCNDLLFHIVMQESETALKSLVSACLHIPLEEIHSIEVLNAIVPGSRVSEKTFILDVLLTLNRERTLNIELQVLNEYNWTDRSLIYLSRIFNNANRGEEYSDIKPATHIGLLNFQLFKDAPAFFSEFKMSNVKTHDVYSDKFVLDVVSLNCTELATSEDIESGLVDWARFFTASTWEELQMLADNNPAIEDAATAAMKGMSDEKLDWELMMREEAYRRQRTAQAVYERAKKEAELFEQAAAEARQEAAGYKQEAVEAKQEAVEAKQKNAALEAEIARLREALSKYE